MAIPREFIASLRERCDIADTVGSYVQLKRNGRLMKGLCPFHSEKTPSFTVFPDTSSFYCFGCQAGGDVITFTQMIERLDYVEAVKLLAARAGMDMPEDGAFDGLAQAKRRMREANREAARYFYKQLYTPQGKHALDYLVSRGLTNDTIAHFGLGWSPESWDGLSKHLRSRGFHEDEIIGANLGFKNRNGGLTDRFRDRVMFPIIDLQGSVIAFGGRTMAADHGGKKYLNTSDTLIYKKSHNLYAMNWAKNSCADMLVVTEGFMDVIAMWQAGFTNVVASQGTAFTAEQARLVSRHTRQIVLSQDGDEAGQNAIKRSIVRLKEIGMDVRVLELPENLDPDEYIKKYGAERMKRLLEGSESDMDYTIRRIRSNYDLSTDDGKLHFLREVCPALSDISPLERDVYAGRIADDLGIDKAAIISQIESGKKRKRFEHSREELKNLTAGLVGQDNRENPESREYIRQRQENVRAANAEEAIIARLFQRPDLADEISKRLSPEGMVIELDRLIYSELLKIISEGGSPELAMLAQSLTPFEMGMASRIINTVQASSVAMYEIERYIAVINEERTRPTKEDISGFSGDDLKDYLASLKSKKK